MVKVEKIQTFIRNITLSFNNFFTAKKQHKNRSGSHTMIGFLTKLKKLPKSYHLVTFQGGTLSENTAQETEHLFPSNKALDSKS
jgi:hypothetical protein